MQEVGKFSGNPDFSKIPKIAIFGCHDPRFWTPLFPVSFPKLVWETMGSLDHVFSHIKLGPSMGNSGILSVLGSIFDPFLGSFLGRFFRTGFVQNTGRTFGRAQNGGLLRKAGASEKEPGRGWGSCSGPGSFLGGMGFCIGRCRLQALKKCQCVERGLGRFWHSWRGGFLAGDGDMGRRFLPNFQASGTAIFVTLLRNG